MSGGTRILAGLALLCGTALAAAAQQPETFTSIPEKFRRNHLQYEKKPTYIDCRAEGVTISPGETKVALDRLNRYDHDLRPFLDEIEGQAAGRYLVIVQRPGSTLTFAALYRAIHLRRIEIAHEFLNATVPLADAVKNPGFVASALARPLDQKPVFFECRTNTVLYVTVNELAGGVQKFINQFRPMTHREDIAHVERRLGEEKFEDEHYSIDGPSVMIGRILLRPRPGSRGEDVREMVVATSHFQEKLKTLDARRHYAHFFVRDDSMEALRAARDVVEKNGLEWRFSLIEGNGPLTFGD